MKQIQPFQKHWLQLTSIVVCRLKPGLYSMRAYARVYARILAHTPTVGAAVYTSVAGCAQRIRAHTPTVAVKVQTCWTFKASADQRRYSSQSRKRSKVTEGRRVDLHRDVRGRIPTHTLACLYFYPRRNLRYAVATHRQPEAWTSAPAAGAYARMEYKPGFTVGKPALAPWNRGAPQTARQKYFGSSAPSS